MKRTMLLINLLVMILGTACQKATLINPEQANTPNFARKASFSTQSYNADSTTLTVYPTESTELITNPGKGFVQYWDFDGTYADQISTGYSRYDWSDIEPQQGVFNWSLIDSEIQKFKAAGKKFAFGVMCANTARSMSTPDKGKYVTPKWVFTAGAKSRTIQTTYWETNQLFTQVIPVWTDAIFLAKLNQFITILGQRYNGSKDIAFIDIRSYGNWGEQHTYEINGVALTAKQLLTQHLQVYKTAFPNTQLITPWGTTDYNGDYDWAVQNGIGIRSDGIFKYSNGSECTRAAGKAPAIFEYTANYAWITSEGYWSPDTLNKYIEIGKPSYIQFDPEMYTANKDLYTQVANRVGYHFVLKSVSLPAAIKNGSPYIIQTEVLNKGVTNIYQSCYPAIALLDGAGNVVQKQWLDSANPSLWLSDTVVKQQSAVTFAGVNPGNYTVAVGLFVNKTDIAPTYKLGNTNKTTNNWYILNNGVTVN
ncbi:DUF4832 domain-containing protein [Mucilaginibacter sp. HMF5004]|uniref:DUF4832 domain-containing protein n=1 Tax=Mucilaginibacter rivuli TaxID=2857527 RepID=UPI001C5CC605|nr:DUF4832 domain-containing protein [Mucilaginibacter rivuli]MBW4890070.1 DUF4832 domain-containing protein [Mucilaginibacter rivuli]